jgi:Cytochrome c
MLANSGNTIKRIDSEELAVSRISLILISGACALAGASFAEAQQTSQATTGWFQQAQAEQGHQLFNNYCAECHGPDLSGASRPTLTPSFVPVASIVPDVLARVVPSSSDTLTTITIIAE